MADATHTLVLLRHGESDWNAKNLFTGWVDVPLSEKGRGEAERGGRLLAAADLLPDVVHTSLLRRAIITADLALDAADRLWIPVKRHWRLNERHYVAVVGYTDGGLTAVIADPAYGLVGWALPAPTYEVETRLLAAWMASKGYAA